MTKGEQGNVRGVRRDFLASMKRFIDLLSKPHQPCKLTQLAFLLPYFKHSVRVGCGGLS